MTVQINMKSPLSKKTPKKTPKSGKVNGTPSVTPKIKLTPSNGGTPRRKALEKVNSPAAASKTPKTPVSTLKAGPKTPPSMKKTPSKVGTPKGKSLEKVNTPVVASKAPKTPVSALKPGPKTPPSMKKTPSKVVTPKSKSLEKVNTPAAASKTSKTPDSTLKAGPKTPPSMKKTPTKAGSPQGKALEKVVTPVVASKTPKTPASTVKAEPKTPASTVKAEPKTPASTVKAELKTPLSKKKGKAGLKTPGKGVETPKGSMGVVPQAFKLKTPKTPLSKEKAQLAVSSPVAGLLSAKKSKNKSPAQGTAGSLDNTPKTKSPKNSNLLIAANKLEKSNTPLSNGNSSLKRPHSGNKQQKLKDQAPSLTVLNTPNQTEMTAEELNNRILKLVKNFTDVKDIVTEKIKSQPGYAVRLTFKSEADAWKAVKRVSGSVLNGHHLTCSIPGEQSSPHQVVITSNNPKDLTYEDAWTALQSCGKIHTMCRVLSKHNGFIIFVRFENAEGVKSALNLKQLKIRDQEISVTLPKEKTSVPVENSVFIKGLSSGTSKEAINKLVASVAPVVSVVFVSKPGNMSYALVHVKNESDVDKVLKLNGRKVGTNLIEVKRHVKSLKYQADEAEVPNKRKKDSKGNAVASPSS